MHKSRKEIVQAIQSHKQRRADNKEVDKKVKEIWKSIDKQMSENNGLISRKERRQKKLKAVKKKIYIQLTTLNIHTVVVAKLKPKQWDKVTDIIKIERGQKETDSISMKDYTETKMFCRVLKNFAIQQARIPDSEPCAWKITW